MEFTFKQGETDTKQHINPAGRTAESDKHCMGNHNRQCDDREWLGSQGHH